MNDTRDTDPQPTSLNLVVSEQEAKIVVAKRAYESAITALTEVPQHAERTRDAMRVANLALLDASQKLHAVTFPPA